MRGRRSAQAVPGGIGVEPRSPCVGAAPAPPASTAGVSGGSGNPPWGHYDPCARSSLQTRPDRREKRGPELGECLRHSLEPQVERREARPPPRQGGARAPRVAGRAAPPPRRAGRVPPPLAGLRRPRRFPALRSPLMGSEGVKRRGPRAPTTGRGGGGVGARR